MIKIDALKRFQIFSSLDDEQLKDVALRLKEVTYSHGDIIVRENDVNEEVFIVVEGHVGLYRMFEDHRDHLIRTIKPGNFFGEAAMFSEELSHATFRSHGKTTVYKLPHHFFDKVDARKNRNVSLILKMAENVSKKLSYVDNLLMIKAEKRRQLSWFLMLTIFLMTGFSYFLAIIRSINISEANATLITVPMMVVLFVIYIIYMKIVGLRYAEFGFTLKNARQSLWDGIVLSLPIFFILTFIKVWLLGIEGVQLSDFQSFFAVPGPLSLLYFLFSPLQEFLARGATQTPLERLLTGVYRVPTAIVISNLVFSAFHSHLTVYYSLASFVIGLYWGWMYHRTHNLLGVSVSHAIIGIYALDVLDLDKMLNLVA